MALFGKKKRAGNTRSASSPFRRRRVIKPGSESFSNHMAGHFAAESGDWEKAINIGLDMWEEASTMQPNMSSGLLMAAEPDLVIWEGLDAWRRSSAWDPEAAYALTRSIFDGLAQAGDSKVEVFGPRALQYLNEAGADAERIDEAERAIYLSLSGLPFEDLPPTAQSFVDLMRSRDQ